MLTLTKKHFDDSAVLTPGWISDGHWAVRREKIANAGLLTTEDSAKLLFPKLQRVMIQETDTRLELQIPEKDAPTWTVSHWTVDQPHRAVRKGPGAKLTLLTSEAGDAAYIATELLSVCEVAVGDKLRSKDARSVFTDSDGTILIMPFDCSGYDPLEPIFEMVSKKFTKKGKK